MTDLNTIFRNQDIAALHKQRIEAARKAIDAGGGPTELARKLSRYLSADFPVNRLAKWRYTGIPVRWGVVIEHLTGVQRAELNPIEYMPADTEYLHKFYQQGKA